MKREVREWLGLAPADLFVYLAGGCVVGLYVNRNGGLDLALSVAAVLLAAVSCVVGMRRKPDLSLAANAAKLGSYPLALLAAGAAVYINYAYWNRPGLEEPPEVLGRSPSSSLRFAWPAKVKAEVTMTGRLLEKGQTHKLRGTFALDAERTGDNWQVLLGNYVFPPNVSTTLPSSQPMWRSISELAHTPAPPFVVGPTGTIVSVEPLKGYSELIEQDLADQPWPPAIKQQMRVMSEGGPRMSAQFFWNLVVGSWLDTDFGTSPSFVQPLSAPLPPPYSGTMETKRTLELKGRVSCDEADREGRCVLISFRAPIEGSQVLTAVREMMERMGTPKDRQSSDTTVTGETAGFLVTAAGSLLPYAAYNRIEYRTVNASGESIRVQETRYDFRYVE